MTGTRVLLITSLLAFSLPATVNYAAAQSSYADCHNQGAACYSHCPTETGSSFSKDLSAAMRGQQCRQDCVNSESRCSEAVRRIIEERKIITCTHAEGNVSHCVQHGRDLKGW